MSQLSNALSLAAKGFHVFPLIYKTKFPLIDDFPNLATTDPEKIRKYWLDPVMGIEKLYNVGISTSKFGKDKALVVVDVDNKPGKNGDESLLNLELEGKFLPPTFTQVTPTGGKHLIYVCESPVKQGVNVLGKGLDIRSKGGYVVGAGSILDTGEYKIETQSAPQYCPEWVIEVCGKALEKSELPAPENVDENIAIARAKYYLEHLAPPSIKGQGGDQTAYKVAAAVKDFGVDAATCLELMLGPWNERSPPGWSPERLKQKVDHAYRYGNQPVGVSAPENYFEPVKTETKAKHPFDELNSEYAFVTAGGGHHILWETTDVNGNFKLEHLNEASFHKKFASRTIMLSDNKARPLTDMWMKSPSRRSYRGICFNPGLPCPDEWYNLWQGFSVEALPTSKKPTKNAQKSVDMFLEHALKNICDGDEKLCEWLIGYFAHLIQKPWDKPLVALVFKGMKGTGKNALVERVGQLLGGHFIVTSDRRYLTGNFNSHLENCLLLTLDEAFWSGDKQSEGALKNLITGKDHLIEHKGKEPYKVANRTRVVILGNEKWLVPATQDERRFAVFNVGNGRKRDAEFFRNMRVWMENEGGYEYLLRYLLDFDLSKVDVNEAPATKGLADQKMESLEPVHQWWLQGLSDGRLPHSDFESDWPIQMDKDSVRAAFSRYMRERNIRSRVPDSRSFSKDLKMCVPGLVLNQKRREGDATVSVFRFPPLEECRKQWENFIGAEINWGE